VHLTVSGELWYWRGPSPFHFITVDDEAAEMLHAVANAVTYGWGMIPVEARVGDTVWATSLFPKEGTYLVPVKSAVRRSEQLAVGDVVTVALTVTM